MEKQVEISGRLIGNDFAPLIVPEIGINHEGSLEKAIQLIDAAKSSGAEIIKFQCHIVEEEMLKTGMKPGNISKETLWDIIERCQFSEDQEYQLKEYTEKQNMIYLSTPFSRKASERLNEMGVKAFKIGSGECNNFPLIKHICKFDKPIILSTGMNNFTDIKKSVDIINSFSIPLIILVCTSTYPSKSNEMRLGRIKVFKDEFKNIPIGLSDHTEDIWTALGSVSFGASLIEKHFTVSDDWPGPDIKVSINPSKLKNLIEGSKEIWNARSGETDIIKNEIPVANFAYASVVSIKKIKSGEKLSDENIWVKRPGDGDIHAREYENIIGKKAKIDIPTNHQLKWTDFE